MISFTGLRELLGRVFTEDFGMFVVVGWDNLVLGADSLVGGLFGKLLCHCGLGSAHGINLHDAEIQLLSGFKEGSALNHGPHTGNPYRAHWFPRCHSFGVDDNGGRKCAHRPIGVCVRRREPWITKNEVMLCVVITRIALSHNCRAIVQDLGNLL